VPVTADRGQRRTGGRPWAAGFAVAPVGWAGPGAGRTNAPVLSRSRAQHARRPAGPQRK